MRRPQFSAVFNITPLTRQQNDLRQEYWGGGGAGVRKCLNDDDDLTMTRPVVFTVQVQNVQHKHNHLFLREISYMFRLNCLAIIRLIMITERKNSQIRGFDISALTVQ